MTHAVIGPDEWLTTKSAPEDRYTVEIRKRGRWRHEVQLIQTHEVRVVGERGEPLRPVYVDTELERPPAVLSLPWARWKARRMVAAAHRRDVRQKQPWTLGEERP